MASIVDCTPRVMDVRTLRAAAFAPYVIALTLLVVAVPLSYTSGERAQAIQFLAASLILFFIAGLIKRGSVAATIASAVCLMTASALALLGLMFQDEAAEMVTGLIGWTCVLGFPNWLAFRAMAASRRLKELEWHPPTATGIRQLLRQLPRDQRLVRALAPLAAAAIVYAAGVLVAIIVALATGHAVFAGLTALPLALAGSGLWQRARRTLARRAAEVRATDNRRPLLLVRSFVDDSLEIERRFEYFGALLRRRMTLEEVIVQHLGTLGPVIAIGKPREGLSPLGAAREYIFGEGWRERVSEVLDECSLVVSILGASHGLLWEYHEVLRRGMAGRFILVIPPASMDVIRLRWHAFRAVFSPAAGAELPASKERRLPLFAIFPAGAAPVLLLSKYQNETAYSVAFAALRPRLSPGL